MNEFDQLSGDEVGADRSVDSVGSAESCDVGAVAGSERGKGVTSLRYLVLLAVLTAMAGCKGIRTKRPFTSGKSGEKIELYDPHAGKVSGGESFLIDPSTGKIIFGAGAKQASLKPENVDKVKSGGEGVRDGEDKNGEKKDVAGAEGGSGDRKEKSKGADEGKVDGAGGKTVASAGNAKGAESSKSAEDLIRRTLIEGYINRALKSLVTSLDIVLPSEDVERDVTFSSSGREVKVHVKISASHLVGVKSRLMGTAQLAHNNFFGDTGEYLDEETLRERLLAEKNSAIGGSVSRVESTCNPNWPLPVSMDDTVLAELTKVVTEKFSTKRGKMQAIADFAVAAVKYKASERRVFSKFPLLTLVDGVGDCKDFSALVAAMGKIVEVECAFADFRDERHMDVACALDGEGTAFVLGGVRCGWVGVTTFLSLYGPKGMGITTNHDGIGVLPDTFGSPEYLQPVLGKPVLIKSLIAEGRLVLNEDRQKLDERSAGSGGK